MISNNLQTTQQELRQRVDIFLTTQLKIKTTLANRLEKAVAHGLLLGGKRVRPFLVYAVGTMLGAKLEQLDHAAAAIECIHAYSLIHDDLPAMDNDELRRGKPTCHIAFDEAHAILAGDALQTLAFELLSCEIGTLSSCQQIKMINALSKASGANGMCGGQALDLAATNQAISIKQLEAVHQAKTGALLCCAVELGTIAGNANEQDKQALLTFAKHIGLAFQVQDDILDITENTQTLGKPQGSDQAANKSTYPALLGLKGAQEKANELFKSALQALDSLPYNTELLAQFAAFIINRKN